MTSCRRSGGTQPATDLPDGRVPSGSDAGQPGESDPGGVDTERVFVTGNTGIDAFHWAAGLHADWPIPVCALDDPAIPVVVVTAHRRENLGEPIRRIAEAVKQIAQVRPDALVVWPVHPNPKVREVVYEVLDGMSNVLLTEPIDYIPFAPARTRDAWRSVTPAAYQEEARASAPLSWWPAPNPNALRAWTAARLILVGSNTDLIPKPHLSLLDDSRARLAMTANINPFGDGHAATRVRSALEHLVFNTTARAGMERPSAGSRCWKHLGSTRKRSRSPRPRSPARTPSWRRRPGRRSRAVPALRRCGGRGGSRRLSTALLVTERPPRSSRSTSSSSSPDEGQGWDGLAVSSTRA